MTGIIRPRCCVNCLEYHVCVRPGDGGPCELPCGGVECMTRIRHAQCKALGCAACRPRGEDKDQGRLFDE